MEGSGGRSVAGADADRLATRSAALANIRHRVPTCGARRDCERCVTARVVADGTTPSVRSWLGPGDVAPAFSELINASLRADPADWKPCRNAPHPSKANAAPESPDRPGVEAFDDGLREVPAEDPEPDPDGVASKLNAAADPPAVFEFVDAPLLFRVDVLL